MSADPAPSGPSRPNWLLRVVLALLALGLLVVGGVGVAVYRWAGQPGNQARLGAFSELMKVSIQAASAPGTAELHQLGCRQAGVFDGRRLSQITESVEMLSGKTEPGGLPLEAGTVSVVCTGTSQAVPSCEAVAQTYAGAVTDAPESFLVVAQKGGVNRDITCQGLYARDGQRLEAIPSP